MKMQLGLIPLLGIVLVSEVKNDAIPTPKKQEEVLTEDITIKSVSMRNQDGTMELFFRAFGKQYQLQLQQSSILTNNTEIFAAEANNDGQTEINKVGSLSDKELGGGLYFINEIPGSVFITRKGTDLEVEGFIDDFYVEPKDKQSEYTQFRHHPGEHRVVKIIRGPSAIDEDPPGAEEDELVINNQTEVPREVVVEILAVMDYRNSKRMNFDKNAITRFLAFEYGAVQRIYNVFKNPAIKFRLSKVFFHKHHSTEPYINNNIINENNIDEKCLFDFRQWVLDLKDLSSVDVAFLHMDFGIYNNASGVESLGLATFGYACKVGAAMAMDEAPYHLGYITVAHELGHLLNAHHDGHMASSHCDFMKGNLMGMDQYNSLKYVPSSCTYESIRKFVLSENAACLRSSGHGFDTEFDKYPGEVMTNDQICRMKMGRTYYGRKWPEQVACSKPLYCCNGRHNNNCTWMGGVEGLEGTRCGFNKMCFKGKCLHLSTIRGRNKDVHHSNPVLNSFHWMLGR